MKTPVQEQPDPKKTFRENIREHRKMVALIFALLFIGMLLLFLLLNSPEQQESSHTNLSPTPSQTVEEGNSQQSQQLRQELEAPHVLNLIKNSNTNVTDYSWNNDQLIYSTPLGIFEAGTNNQLVSKNIAYIKFNNKGSAIYQSSGNWFIYKHPQQELQQVTINGTTPVISKDGNIVSSFFARTLQLYNKETGETISTNVGSEVSSQAWSNDSISVFTSDRRFILYDKNLNVQKELRFSQDDTFLTTSPDAKTLALAQKEKLIFFDIESGQESSSFKFDNLSTLSGNWIDENNFIVIETNSDNPIGRINNNLWKISDLETKIFLVNSKPIPRKLNYKVELKTNSSKNVLPLVENGSKLWILGLIPGKLPAYSSQGVTLHSLPPQRQAE